MLDTTFGLLGLSRVSCQQKKEKEGILRCTELFEFSKQNKTKQEECERNLWWTIYIIEREGDEKIKNRSQLMLKHISH